MLKIPIYFSKSFEKYTNNVTTNIINIDPEIYTASDIAESLWTNIIVPSNYILDEWAVEINIWRLHIPNETIVFGLQHPIPSPEGFKIILPRDLNNPSYKNLKLIDVMYLYQMYYQACEKLNPSIGKKWIPIYEFLQKNFSIFIYRPPLIMY